MMLKYDEGTSGGICFQRGRRAKGGINWVVLSSMSVCGVSDSASRSWIWPKYSPPATCKSKPVHFPGRLYFQIMTSLSVPPASMSRVHVSASAPAVQRGARKTATKQNNSPFCPFWAFRLFARISLGPFSTWLIHLVFCWPLLPWLTGNTSITSHRG